MREYFIECICAAGFRSERNKVLFNPLIDNGDWARKHSGRTKNISEPIPGRIELSFQVADIATVLDQESQHEIVFLLNDGTVYTAQIKKIHHKTLAQSDICWIEMDFEYENLRISNEFNIVRPKELFTYITNQRVSDENLRWDYVAQHYEQQPKIKSAVYELLGPKRYAVRFTVGEKPQRV